MKKSNFNLKNLILCAILLSAFAFLSLQARAQSNSSDGSESVTVKQTVLNDCGRALDELEIYDKLIESKENEIRLLTERVQLEREKSKIALELADARKGEADGYKAANDAHKEAIAAKDSQINNLQKEVELLKKKKQSLFKRILDVAAGIGIGILLK